MGRPKGSTNKSKPVVVTEEDMWELVENARSKPVVKVLNGEPVVQSNLSMLQEVIQGLKDLTDVVRGTSSSRSRTLGKTATPTKVAVPKDPDMGPRTLQNRESSYRGLVNFPGAKFFCKPCTGKNNCGCDRDKHIAHDCGKACYTRSKGDEWVAAKKGHLVREVQVQQQYRDLYVAQQVQDSEIEVDSDA